MKEFTVSENTTLSKFTDDSYAQASFVFRALLKDRGVRVNGKSVKCDMPLYRGDVVQYFLTPAQAAKCTFTILYEDENVIAVDKESGVNSEAVFSALSERGECHFIHRLDRNTAGVMIFGKTAAAERELLHCFRERRTLKIYEAVVCGRMDARHAVEEGYLRKDEAAGKVFISKSPIGEKILTEYEVLAEEGGFSLLKITLHTGKTHQIRAHMAFLGHPVLGDEKYGDSALNRRYHATRQRLLAKQLTLFPEGALQYLSGKPFFSPKKLNFPEKNA